VEDKEEEEEEEVKERRRGRGKRARLISKCLQRLAKVSRILGAIEKLLLRGIKKCYVDIWQPTLK